MKTVKSFSPKTKILSLVLSFLIIFYIVPTSVFAEGLDKDTTVADNTASENEENTAYAPEIYEVTDLREENVKHFRLADGSYVAVQYNYPVHYTDENGEFIDIDNRLVESNIEFTTNNSRVKFIKKITGNGNIFTLHENNTKITMGLVGAEKKTKGVVTSTHNSDDAIEDTLGKLTNLENISSTILFEDILDGVDIEYIVHSLNIKENIIVKERKNSYSYTFTIELNNFTAILSEHGDVYINSYDGETQYVIPAPIVYDAIGTYAPENASAYTLSGTGSGKYELTVTVDSSWMNEENRAFPVIIDPSVMSSGGTVIDFNIDSASPDTNTNGTNNFYVSSTKRSYIKFDEYYFPDIPSGASIMKAELSVISYYVENAGPKVGAYSITSDWDETLTWNKTLSTSPEGSFSPNALDYVVINKNAKRFVWNITELYKGWLKGAPNYGIGLRLVDETATGESARFMAYEYHPSIPDEILYDPAILVTYIYNDGLEDYYPTVTHSAGSGGVGSINLSTGRLTLAIPTLTTTDSLFAFTPTLVYNSSLAGKPATSENVSSAFSDSYLPYGFKLNVQETIVSSYYFDSDDFYHQYYVLYDADGTTHRFYQETALSPYYDDDGLRLTLTEGDNILTIEDVNHNIKTYSKLNNSSWYLTSIADKYGNELIFYGKNDIPGKPETIYVQPNGLNNIEMLRILYEGDKLCAVYNDTSKDSVILGYDGNYLNTVKYCYGNSNTTADNVRAAYANPEETPSNVTVYATATYTYDGGYITEITDSNTNKTLKYKITDGKVTKLSECAGETLGQQVSYNYSEGYTDVRSTGNDEILNTTDDLITRYIFDDYGRAVNAYSMSSNGEEIYGATLGSYNNSESSKNSIKYSAVLGGVDPESIIENLSGADGHFATIQGGINTNESNGAYKQTIFIEDYVASLTESNADMEYIISGFGYSNSIIHNESTDFSIGVDVHYYQGENLEDVVVKYRFKFADVENVRQYVCDKFNCKLQSTETVNYDYVRKIEVVCSYYGQIDTGFGAPYAYFDDIAITDFGEQGGYNYSYSQSGNLTDKENSLYQEWYEYDEENQIERIGNSYGEVYEYQYIEESNKTIHKEKYSKNDNSLSETSYTYNAYGLLTETKYVGFIDNNPDTASCISTEYEYITTSGSKIFGALSSETDSLGYTTTYIYNSSNGQLERRINNSSNTGYYYLYDDASRLTLVTPYPSKADNEFVLYGYDSANYLNQITTQSTNYTLEYDDFGNALEVRTGNNTLADYEYYPNNGKLKKINYGNGFSEEYVYNTLEMLSEVWYTYDDGTRVCAYEYEYTSCGQLYKIVDNLLGKTIIYSYDSMGRISISEQCDSEEECELYSEYSYDDRSRPIMVTRQICYSVGYNQDYLSLIQEYGYNNNNLLCAFETYGANIGYSYDSFNRLTNKSVSYAASGSTPTYTNEVSYDYKPNSYLVNEYQNKINGTTTSRFTYKYDSLGNITKITDKSGKEIRYYYDTTNKLSSVIDEIANKEYIYHYDNAGNITSIVTNTLSTGGGIGDDLIVYALKPTLPSNTTTFSYTNSEWGDLLTSYNGHTITYDEIGNPLSYYNGSSYTFTWDGRRLASIEKGLVYATFIYNDEGLRLSKTVNGVVHTYQLNGSQIVSECWGDKLIVYLYDASGAPIGMMYRTTSYAVNTFDVFWYEKNLQGDIIAIYNESGTKLVTYTYDAWGNQTVSYFNGGASTGAKYNPFRYRGYYYDTDLAMYYLQSRYYDSKICRFISPDTTAVLTATPMALTDKNLYAYCDNNPVTRVDDDGEFWNYVIGGVVGAIVGGVVAGVTSYLNDGKVDLASVVINAAVGAISGVVAASGLGAIAQAGITAGFSGLGNFVDQAQSKGIENVNLGEVATSTVLGGLTSLAGTGAGKVLGGKWLNQATELTNLGQSKLLTGVIRRAVGQSHSALIRQGYKYLAMATLPTNIFRGISSVAGSVISGTTTAGFNATKGLWGW